MIPKILFQTSYKPIEPYVTEKLKKYISGKWTYLHFNDDDIKEFFRKNPLYEFPEIEKVFDSFMGQHKADLFRYYFLYINGGVFIDSDAMLRCSLDEVIADCDLFCVISDSSMVFNGFIGSTPKHQIIYDALVDVYNTNASILITSYGAWQIPEINCIITSQSIQDLNTPLALILKEYLIYIKLIMMEITLF